MKEKELEKNAPFDVAFKEREKLAGEQLKCALAKRRKEIPQIIAVLETQKALLDLRGNLAAYNLSLHDIVQNFVGLLPRTWCEIYAHRLFVGKRLRYQKSIGALGGSETAHCWAVAPLWLQRQSCFVCYRTRNAACAVLPSCGVAPQQR